MIELSSSDEAESDVADVEGLVLFDYIPPCNERSLTLREHQSIRLIENFGNGWGFGECAGRFGHFPLSSCTFDRSIIQAAYTFEGLKSKPQKGSTESV